MISSISFLALLMKDLTGEDLESLIYILDQGGKLGGLKVSMIQIGMQSSLRMIQTLTPTTLLGGPLGL